MPRLKTAFLLASLITAGLFALCLPVGAVPLAAPGTAAESPYRPGADQTAQVDAALAQAREEGKLALIVMGASWCHDSMAFADHARDPAVTPVIDAKYILRYLDVGYLEHGQEVIRRFGMPVIYGTPTVLVIDPESEQLLNRETMFRWRDAAAMTADEAAALLASQPPTLPPVPAPEGELKRLLAEIDAFEEAQAARIYGGFRVIGPMLAGERPKDFYAYWNQLRDLRYSITDDLERLRREARARVAAGEHGITLAYPAYPAFSWEN
jgi:hypothetical protein